MKIIEIFCPLALKDAVVDIMLDYGEEEFYFFPCSRYGMGTLLTNAEEEVSARSKYCMFRLVLDEERIDTMIDLLKGHLNDKTFRIYVYNIEER